LQYSVVFTSFFLQFLTGVFLWLGKLHKTSENMQKFLLFKIFIYFGFDEIPN